MQVIQPKNLRVDDILFYLAYGTWLTIVVLQWYTFYSLFIDYNIVVCARYFCTVILAISELLQIKRGVHWTWKSILVLAFLIVLAICTICAQADPVLWALPFLFCARNRNVNVILSITAIVFLCIVMATVFGAKQGVIPDHLDASANRTRQFIGFRYPLYPATMLFISSCCIVCIKKDRISYFTLFALATICVTLFYLSDSRLSFTMSMLVLLFSALFTLAPKRQELPPIACLLLSCGFIVSAILSITVSAIYDPSSQELANLNTILGERLRLGHDGIQNFGLTIFGQPVEMVSGTLTLTGESPSGTYNFIDSIYVQCLVHYGIAFLLIYVAGMTFAGYLAFKQGDYIVGVVLALIAIHGIIDNQTIYLWMNPFMFYAVSAFSENHQQDDLERHGAHSRIP